MDADNWVIPVLAMGIGYLFGSVPSGLLVMRAAGQGDVRAVGSGNIGATNVLRTGHRGLAALTLLLDVVKGVAAVLVVKVLESRLGISSGPDDHPLALLAATGAFLGHLYPVWLRFRGGKGVAVFLGIALALEPLCGLVFGGVWLAALALTRYSSLGGMAGAIATPVAAAWLGRFDITLLFIVFALLVLWRHRGNLERLLAGTEPKIGAGAGPGPGEKDD